VLDLPKTREALETLGVPVYGFATDRFPAFYGRDSGLPVDARFDDVRALAEAVRMHFRFGSGGVVVANPVPAKDELKAAIYEKAIGRALADAESEGVAGRDVTPFLLARLRELTKGKSVETNRALLVDNARLAARLAVALAKLDH
jgi:pseudouridylate synthase